MWEEQSYMAVCQNLVPLVNIKIAGKWMFIPLKMVSIGIDPYPYHKSFKPPMTRNHIRTSPIQSLVIGHLSQDSDARMDIAIP